MFVFCNLRSEMILYSRLANTVFTNRDIMFRKCDILFSVRIIHRVYLIWVVFIKAYPLSWCLTTLFMHHPQLNISTSERENQLSGQGHLIVPISSMSVNIFACRSQCFCLGVSCRSRFFRRPFTDVRQNSGVAIENIQFSIRWKPHIFWRQVMACGTKETGKITDVNGQRLRLR